MAAALAQVKATIGEVTGCSNRAIEDILWDYYYDVPKTINYILGRPQLFSMRSGLEKAPRLTRGCWSGIDTYRPATPVKEKKKKQPKAKGQPQANTQKKGERKYFR